MCRPFYELNEAARLAAAHELGNNLPLWFNKTFEPSERRASYFNAIKPQVKRCMASNAEFALVNRLPIILLKAASPEEEPVDSKITKPKAKLMAKVLPNGAFIADNELLIEIT